MLTKPWWLCEHFCRRDTPLFVSNSFRGNAVDAHDYFAKCPILFHHPLCFSNILEAKHSGWFCFVTTCGYLINNSLEWNIRQRKVWCPEHKTAKEAEVDSARHL